MDGKLKIVALIGAVLVTAAWARAELEIGNSAASPRLISVALSTPPYNPLPGGSHLPVANPYAAMHNTSYAAMHNRSATNLWAGTAWGEYFSEPYHYQCGGKPAWQMHGAGGYGAGGCGAGGCGAGGCGAGGCDAGGCDAGGSSSRCHCLDRFLQNLTLFQRRCTACDAVASCDTCDSCDSCSAAGGDQWDTQHEEPPQPEPDQGMDDVQLDPMPEPMRDPVPEPMDAPMPKEPAPVTPPRNPLPKTTWRPLSKSASRPPRLILKSAPAAQQAAPQQPPRLVLQPTARAQQPPRLVLQPSEGVQQPRRIVLQSPERVQQPRRIVLQPQRIELQSPQARKTRQMEIEPQQPRLTQSGKAMLRFRTSENYVKRPQQAGLSLILLLSGEQR